MKKMIGKMFMLVALIPLRIRQWRIERLLGESKNPYYWWID